MHRREFLIRSATGVGAAWLSSKTILDAIAAQTLPAQFAALAPKVREFFEQKRLDIKWT